MNLFHNANAFCADYGLKVAVLAHSYTAEAIIMLVDLMRRGKDDRVRGTAAQAAV